MEPPPAASPPHATGHTATLLPNGKVLSSQEDMAAAAISPARNCTIRPRGTWTATGSLGTARYCHTATLLPNGKVLVAGGVVNGGVLASAELYDPATGTWTATGSLATARYYHTATLLPNGKVLVAGGYNSSGSLASAELYDPATGTWTATGSLTTARCSHTATLLPNGKVLVAGGYGPQRLSRQRGTVRSGHRDLEPPPAASPPHAIHHTATLLPNGKVLVAAAMTAAAFSPARNCTIRPPGPGRATGSLATARYSHTATLLPNGKVLVAGGV